MKHNKASDVVLYLAVYIEYELFPKLKEEYKLADNVELILPEDYVEYIVSEWEHRYKNYVEKAEQLLFEISNDFLDSSFVCTKFDWDEKEERLNHRIIIAWSHIKDLVLSNIDLTSNGLNEDLLKRYLELVVRHEIGHILYHDNLIRTVGKDEFFKYINSNTEFGDYLQFCNKLDEDEDISEKEYYTLACHKYYTMTEELNANKFANVDTNELIKFELLTRYQINNIMNIKGG